MAYWGDNPTWRGMSGPDRAAAMALMEADSRSGRPDMTSARNALGAMINRAARGGEDIGDHVSQRIYQPTIEDAQLERLSRIVGTPEHRELVKAYEDRTSGRVPDWVDGATHFLAPERTMLNLEAREPAKYKSWRDWTGFDPTTSEYKGVIMRDPSHAFLAPEGRHSARFGDPAAPAPTGDSASPLHPDAGIPWEPAAAPTAAPAAPFGMSGPIGASAAPEPSTASAWAPTVTPEASSPFGLSAGDPKQMAALQQQMSAQAKEPDPAPQQLAMGGRPVDLKRLMSVLQNRSRLGSGGMA